MDNQEIRRKIIELLYDNASKGSERVTKGILKKELGIGYNELNFNINYLEKERYISVERFMGGHYVVEIRSRGINLVENPKKFDSLFPLVNITQIYNSKGVVVGSSHIKLNIDESVNIKDSFNEIYNELRNQKNSDEIIEKIKAIEHELNNDTINKSKIKNSMDWLKRNANWTIPSIVQIITSVFL
ncbi:MAG: hypothetical protein Q4P17_06285 [Methanobacterium sp.]|nr:hypothetical protein [Methanobacterium sp.]